MDFKNQGFIFKLIIGYFWLGFFFGAIGAAGLASFASWTELYLADPTPFNFVLSLANTVLAVALLIPVELFLLGKGRLSKQFLTKLSFPAILIAYMCVAGAFVITAYTVAETEFGIEMTFPITVLSLGIVGGVCTFLLAMIFSIAKLRRAAYFTYRKLFLPVLMLAIGATGWAFATEYLILPLESGIDKLIHFIALTGAIGGVTLGFALFFGANKICLGFFSGFGAATVFVDYVVFGCIKLFEVPAEYYYVIALGFVGFYLLLGVIYCLARFKKIKEFIQDGIYYYWR